VYDDVSKQMLIITVNVNLSYVDHKCW